MNELVFDCTSALTKPTFPTCPVDYGQRPVKVLIMKEGGTITASSGANPTAAQFQTAIDADEVVVIEGITNGNIVENSATELSGDDTESGGSEKYDVYMRLSGKVKRFNEAVKRALETYTRYSTLRMWYVTDKNYCFGGTEGYKASPDFGFQSFEGVGQPTSIPFYCDYLMSGADYANYDADYDTLDNS